MKIEIRLRIDVGDDGPGDEEILVLDKPHDQLEKVGLSLAEAKELLGRVQHRVVGAQAAAFVADHRHCDACGRPLWSKGRTSLQFRTPFGDVPVTGPRLKSCPCQSATRGSFSALTGLFTEHVAPEMLYLETKWASLVPFGVTVELLTRLSPGLRYYSDDRPPDCRGCTVSVYDSYSRSSHASGAPVLSEGIPILCKNLAENRVVAMVSLSANWYRTSHFAAKYFLDHDYRVIPVNSW